MQYEPKQAILDIQNKKKTKVSMICKRNFDTFSELFLRLSHLPAHTTRCLSLKPNWMTRSYAIHRKNFETHGITHKVKARTLESYRYVFGVKIERNFVMLLSDSSKKC